MKGADRVRPMLETNDVRALAIGFVGGIASGMLGVGGGVVLVPALVLALRLQQRDANVVSLAAIIPIAAVGAIFFAGAGNIDARLAAALLTGSMVGAMVGAKLLIRTPEPVLRGLFAIVAALAGVKMLMP